MLIQCKLADFPMSEGKSYMVPQERLYEEQELYLTINSKNSPSSTTCRWEMNCKNFLGKNKNLCSGSS